jgi:hypothetical protein
MVRAAADRGHARRQLRANLRAALVCLGAGLALAVPAAAGAATPARGTPPGLHRLWSQYPLTLTTRTASTPATSAPKSRSSRPQTRVAPAPVTTSSTAPSRQREQRRPATTESRPNGDRTGSRAWIDRRLAIGLAAALVALAAAFVTVRRGWTRPVWRRAGRAPLVASQVIDAVRSQLAELPPPRLPHLRGLPPPRLPHLRGLPAAPSVAGLAIPRLQRGHLAVNLLRLRANHHHAYVVARRVAGYVALCAVGISVGYLVSLIGR